MEFVTTVLAYKSKSILFRLHPLCKNIKLINLCMAEDLMVVSKDHLPIIRLVHEAVDYSHATALQTNQCKSQAFISGVSEVTRRRILNLTGSQEGLFPIRYLSVSLSPKDGLLYNMISLWKRL